MAAGKRKQHAEKDAREKRAGSEKEANEVS